MKNNNFVKGTVKYGTQKEADHWLWQKVRNTSSYDLYSGSKQDPAEKTESQCSLSAAAVEEPVYTSLHSQVGFDDSPAFPQKDVANFSYSFGNQQVHGHTPLVKFSNSDSKSYGPQKISKTNAPNEVKVEKLDNVMDRVSQMTTRAKPAAYGRGQDSKGFWSKKAMCFEDQQGKHEVDESTGSSKHRNHHKPSNARRTLHSEIRYSNAETIPETMELRRPKSAPSNANGFVGGFQELRTNVQTVQNMAKGLFASNIASQPEVLTIKDHAAAPSTGHFLERQLSLDGFESPKISKTNRLGKYTDKTSQKERVGEKDSSSYYAVQKWAPVGHSFQMPSINRLMQDKSQHDDDEQIVDPSCIMKGVENAGTRCFEQRKHNLDLSEINSQCLASKEMIASTPGEILTNDHSNLQCNRNIELGVFSSRVAQSNDNLKSPFERDDFAPGEYSPAELKDHPGNLLPAHEKFSSIAPKILDAVHASLEGRRASQRLAVAVGSPVAELEKVLEAVAPILKPVLEASESKKSHRTCKQETFRAEDVLEHGAISISDTFRDDPICRCQADDFPLSAIWSWYEESCNYGVEVKSLDCRRTDICSRGEHFSVFFVPYLSGMQLYERVPSCEHPKGELEPSSLLCMDGNRENFNHQGPSEFCNIEIFDTLLPKPLVRDDVFSSCCSNELEDTGELTCRTCFRHSEISSPNEMHLLFEFYDSEPPQQRRTLLQKVQELIRGEVSVHCRKEGDGALLGSLKLGDLHPASWFSVAWYPIYRIPEGLARDVFLTYHSFCHLIPSKKNWGAEGLVDICIPVIGLQPYNCQVDQWLTLGATFQKQKELREAPADVLQRRLNTLKKAADAMSGYSADPMKTSSMVYKHSDYQFFVNRGR